MRKTLSFILSLFLLFGALVFPASASAAEGGRVEFKAAAPDAGGVFTVAMTMSNLTFNVIRFALRFDPTVIQPVDASGAAAAEFFDFAAKSAPWLSTIGCSVDARTGFTGFTGYVSPGEGAALITNGEAVLGDEGVTVFTFRFRQLKAGDPALRIATQEQGEPYEEACPEGVRIAGRAGRSAAALVFDMTALEGGSSASGSIVPPPDTPQYTAESLLKAGIFMKIGSHAVVAGGGVTAFYPGEPDVSPYIDYPDRTYVPLRFVAEKLGCVVEWDGAARAAVITKGATTVVMPIGSQTYTVNGESRTMDAAAVLKDVAGADARTMVPIRFVAEALGMTVDWDDGYRFAVIVPGDYDWDPAGSLEREVLDKANSLLAMYGGFV